MHDVFISYSSQDQKIADAVVNILESQKIKCWIAYRDAEAGDDYAVSIIRAIKASKVCVLILSRESNSSKHVLNEINSCVNNGVSIMPFKISDVLLNEAIEYYLGKTHWLDAITPPLEVHMNKLADRIKTFIDKEQTINVTSSATPITAKTADRKVDRFATRMVKYEELVGLGYNADTIAIQLVENDYINCNGIGEENEGNAPQWAKFVQNSTETFQFLLNGENKIVGDWSILALNKQMFDEAKEGRLLEKDITYEKSEMIVFPDIYYGYVLAITLLPDYRTMQNYMQIINSFYAQLEIYAENGIFFKEWCMNIFSSEIENLMKKMGFVYLCDNMTFGKIYHQIFIPLPKNPLINKFPKLKQFYEGLQSD
ncbi:MAG: toll/interleukin-1 receptor domain-containing protein [Treponema sp.]|jgi:hypothetical protein|nr:toll/interleukin-1 receptor domain-containing protein [Treponema sp.]